ncbi:MAG: hypothetical protein LBK03_07000 [Bacteroidales bacterium]|jgi:hypothetical protein|nr:hypothetical protein [Bacteroidales bacterium]
MKYIINLFIVAAVVTICLTACDKDSYFNYVVEGRVIDKITREPVSDIMVSFLRYDDLVSQKKKAQKLSPPEYDGWSDENGKFCTHLTVPGSLIYFYSYKSGLYKDTTISVNFSNVPLSGTPHKNYKGDYVLNIGDIELEKQDTHIN